MGISENLRRELRRRRELAFHGWRSWIVDQGWWLIACFTFAIVLGGVFLILGLKVAEMGSEVVVPEIVSLAAFITLIAVAFTAGMIAWSGIEALRDWLPSATSQRVGLVVGWAGILAAVASLCLALVLS